ncbi:MAG TPA: transposase, partial [Nitrospiraceae bacterium]|nr:transposase [Nitrospiraceae bacterium]
SLFAAYHTPNGFWRQLEAGAMAMGKRDTEQQQDLFVTHDKLPRSPGHVFYDKLNTLLREGGFDAHVEALCEPYYAKGRGRPSVPPGVYFRMLLVGYFEGIGSQRGIAWRCSDSLSLRQFLGIPPGEESPDHSSLSYIRNRLPLTVHEAVFVWFLALARDKKLLQGQTVAVDSTTLEANAAMKSIVRRDTGEDWNDYLARLMQEQGLIGKDDQRPSDEELRKFDKGRKNKKVSNEEWQSPTDPDSRIARMKDGTTHLAYKAEHVVDLETEIILAAEIYHADFHDTATLEDSLHQAQLNQQEAGSSQEIQEVAADKGYHAVETIANLDEHTTYRTYIPEPESRHQRVWSDKSPEQKRAVQNNRRRTRGDHGKHLQRLRSERVERSFAHVCETGGARRTWLVGIEKVRKRYLMSAVAHNLGVIMRSLFKMGTPRGRQQFRTDLAGVVSSLYLAWLAVNRLINIPWRPDAAPTARRVTTKAGFSFPFAA